MKKDSRMPTGSRDNLNAFLGEGTSFKGTLTFEGTVRIDGKGLQELRPRNEARVLSMVLYLLMGWVALIALVPLVNALGRAGFTWVAAGGLFYTVGSVFYALDTRLSHAHGVWHLFLVAGSTAHYVAILKFVL